MGLSGEREGPQGAGRAPPLAVQIGLGEGGGTPLSFPSPIPFLLPLPPSGILLGLGVLVGLLSLARPTGAGQPPPLLLYIRGQGAP